MTVIRTAKAVYTVERVEAPAVGATVLHARSASGKPRRLTLKDVGRTRFDAAVAHFYRRQVAA